MEKNGINLKPTSNPIEFVLVHYGGDDNFKKYGLFRSEIFDKHLIYYDGEKTPGGSFIGDGEAMVRIQDRTVTFKGMFYDGDFIKGVITYDNGLIYDGHFKKNIANGICSIRYPDSSSYIGEVRYELKHGDGEYKMRNGSWYKGRFLGETMTGKGELYLAKEDVRYKGEFFMDKRHGYGKLSWENGDYYLGFWKADLMDGHGKFHKHNQYSYEGDYKNGKRTGKGREHNNAEEWTYEGEWVDGFFEGEGVFTDPHGTVFRGNFVKGMKKGTFKVQPKHKPETTKVF